MACEVGASKTPKFAFRAILPQHAHRPPSDAFITVDLSAWNMEKVQLAKGATARRGERGSGAVRTVPPEGSSVRGTGSSVSGNDALQRIRELDQERASLMEEAKGHALAAANEAVEQLNGLGFNYRLVQDMPAGIRRAIGSDDRKPRRPLNPDRPCPICGFTTNPPHDARAHRNQGVNKQAFTAEELSTKVMQRV